MLTIPDELKTFKDTVTEGALGNMNTTISNISDKLSTLSAGGQQRDYFAVLRL